MWWHRLWQSEREQWRNQAQSLTFSETTDGALKELLKQTTKRVAALHSSELSLKGRAATMAGIFCAVALGIIGFMATHRSPVHGATLLVGPGVLAVVGLFLGAGMCFRAAMPTYGVEPGVLPFEFKGGNVDELYRQILQVYVKDMVRGLTVQDRRISQVWYGAALGLGTIAISVVWSICLLLK